MLDKLYITPRQWMHILRWTMYALLLLLAMMVQTVVLGNRTIFGIKPDFVPVVIVCVCLREGPERGGLFALLASFFWYLSGADQGSIGIAVLTVLPVLGSVLLRSTLTNRFLPCLLFTLFTLLTQHSLMFLWRLIFDKMDGTLFFTRLLPCVLVSLLVQPPVYWLVKRIEKIGEPYEST